MSEEQEDIFAETVKRIDDTVDELERKAVLGSELKDGDGFQIMLEKNKQNDRPRKQPVCDDVPGQDGVGGLTGFTADAPYHNRCMYKGKSD